MKKKENGVLLKQRIFIVLCLSIILTSVHSETYKCADELEQGGVCILTSKDPTTKERTVYVKKCGNGETCKEVNYNNFGGCYKLKTDALRDEDEKCKVNEECFSQSCVSGKCKHVADGDNCDYDYQCKSTSYCSSDRCRAYKKPGEKCDGECINGYLCGKSGSDTESKCIAKYSIEDGTAVTDSDLCKSGQLDDNNKCITYTLAGDDCFASDKCPYKSVNGKKFIYGYCETKSDGKTKACSEINGDLWDKYVTAYTKRLNKIKDDKDYNRHSSKWSRYLGDRDVSDAYVEWRYNVLFSDASDCVKDFIKQQEASSNFIVFNVMLIISFVLILI